MAEKRYELRGPFLRPGQNGVLLVRQATEKGFIECPPLNIFDASYVNSPYRRARVQRESNISPTVMAGEGEVYLFQGIEEYEKTDTSEQ